MRRARRIFLSASILSALMGFAFVSDSVGNEGGETGVPRLHLPRIEESDLSLIISGEDPAAPRTLVLWRWDGREFQRVAETRSSRSGEFDFGTHPIGVGTYYDVTVRNERPSTDRMMAVDGAVRAPQVTSGAGIGGSEVLIHPACQQGEIRIYDAATGRLRVRFPIDPRASSPNTLDLDLDEELGEPQPHAVLIGHWLADGRRSPPTFWRLDQTDSPD